MRRAVSRVLILVMAATVVVGCRPAGVELGEGLGIGDEVALVSDIVRTVSTELDGERTSSRSHERIVLEQQVVDVDDGDLVAAATLRSDDAPPRRFEARVDRTGRLRGIDLLEGMPTASLGLDLGVDLPPELSTPPTGPLHAGQRWQVDEPVVVEPGAPPVVAFGNGRIDRFGHEAGRDVVVVVVDVSVPISVRVEGVDGRVRLVGRQVLRATTAYDLAEGTIWRDDALVEAELDVLVEPPVGVDAVPVEGTLRYAVTVATRRIEPGHAT